MEDIQPNTLGRPTDKPIVKRLARPVDRRRVGPAPARLQHMDNPTDYPPILHPRHAACVVGRQRRQTRPLLIRQPTNLAHRKPAGLCGGHQRAQEGSFRHPAYAAVVARVPPACYGDGNRV